MNYNNNLANDIWFGEVNKNANSYSIRSKIAQSSSCAEKVLAVAEGLKLGDFSFKKDLVSLLHTSREDNVINLCIRLFASTATHNDLVDDNNLAFLATANQTAIEAFVTSATDFMSIFVISYLLAILEEWDDTEIGVSIRDQLDEYLDMYAALGEACRLDEIGAFCVEKIPQYDKSTYYSKGNAAFPGDLTKTLSGRAFQALQSGDCLKMSIIPERLSIWSGNRCPASYNTVVTQRVYKQILQYIDELSRQKWLRGKKYFYGHEVR